jgi:RNAse (barnase) inhibitor barstar
MTYEHLLEATPPWFHVLLAEEAVVDDLAVRFHGPAARDTVIRVLRGNHMSTVDSLLVEFASALQFPSYFGHNFNALKDCLTDLAWLPASAYVLCVTHAEMVLADAPPDDLGALLQLLLTVCATWAKAERTTEPWSRSAIAFHVILQARRAEGPRLARALTAASVAHDLL